MLFKYVKNSTNFNFYFDGILIPLASDHKHLGITLSEEIKWNKHVENLIKEKDKKKKSVSKHVHVCVLRKLKCKLNKQYLEKLYLIYIRPIFESGTTVVSLIRANWRDYSWRQLELAPNFQSLPTQNIYLVV